MNNCSEKTKKYNSIFKDNIYLFDCCMELIDLSRTQKFSKISEKAPALNDKIFLLINFYIDNPAFFGQDTSAINKDFLTDMLSSINNAYVSKDYILLADLYELQVVPQIKEIQSILIDFINIYSSTEYLDKNLALLKIHNITLFKMISNHVYDSQKYLLNYSDTGLISLSIHLNATEHYLTTLQNPQYDGKILAEHYFEENRFCYTIYGFGMGYHLTEMSKKYVGATINIFESDLSVLSVAFRYTDLSTLLENENVHIHYDPDFSKLSEVLNKISLNNNTSRFLMHYPSIGNIKLPSIKNWMEDIFTKDYTSQNAFPKLIRNFKSNILHYDASVDTLKESFCNKTMFLIAGGPSLDKNIHLLRNIPREHCIILAVGTVIKKLLNLNIQPDYFIISDPTPGVYQQIAGIEECIIPMLYLSTALKDVALNYKGKKYIIFQNEFDASEEYATKMGFSLYNTGGSVSTTALDVGIQLGCEKIIFLGLDLAYTDDYAHASDTSSHKADKREYTRQVKSPDGKILNASSAFVWYREWIEHRIRTKSKIEFIDATEGGAYIEGTTVMTLLNAIKQGLH